MTNTFAIEGELTVFTAHEIKTGVLAAMSAEGALHIDLSEVSECDGAGLQLLLAARHEAAQRGGAMRLTSPPNQVKAVLELAGLTDHFESSEPDTQEATS